MLGRICPDVKTKVIGTSPWKRVGKPRVLPIKATATPTPTLSLLTPPLVPAESLIERPQAVLAQTIEQIQSAIESPEQLLALLARNTGDHLVATAKNVASSIWLFVESFDVFGNWSLNLFFFASVFLLSYSLLVVAPRQ